MLIFIGCVALYLVLAAITFGVFQELKNLDDLDLDDLDDVDLFMVSVFFPISWIWFGILRYIKRLASRAVRWQVNKAKARQLVRKDREYEQRMRIAEGEREMELALSEEQYASGSGRHVERRS